MSSAPASPPPGAPSLRVLLAYRGDIDTKGGAAYVMERTATALRELGVEAEVSYETTPALDGYDLVHAFNVWSPGRALEQLRYLRGSGVPVVWQPFYLHWQETAWAGLAVRAVLGQSDPSARARLVQELAGGRVVVNGMTRFSPNEIVPGFDAALGEMLSCVDHVCVTSHHEMQLLSQVTRLASKPYSLVRHGVDSEIFANASALPFEEFSGLRDFVLCVGAVDARKNQALLAEALRDSGLTLVLVGPCFEPDYLELVRACGGERLVHFERLPQQLVASAFKAAAVHALPSFAEASALANLEAAAAGCPLVVSNRSSEFEYYGDLPYYCDPTDADGIRSAVETAYAERESEQERWRRLAATVRGYTWPGAAEATLEVYRRTLARAGRALVPATRSFVTVAFADELVAAPERLGAYAHAFTAGDDATLVILVDPGRSDGLSALEGAVAAAGLAVDSSVDMVASTLAPQEWRVLAAGADAVFSAGEPRRGLERLPRFGPGETEALRAAAQSRWLATSA